MGPFLLIRRGPDKMQFENCNRMERYAVYDRNQVSPDCCRIVGLPLITAGARNQDGFWSEHG